MHIVSLKLTIKKKDTVKLIEEIKQNAKNTQLTQENILKEQKRNKAKKEADKSRWWMYNHPYKYLR